MLAVHVTEPDYTVPADCTGDIFCGAPVEHR